jgi:hypothetical protein
MTMSTVVKKNAGPAVKRFILLDPTRMACQRLAKEETFCVRKVGQLDEAFRHSSPDSLWIAMRSEWTERLSGAACARFIHYQERPVLGDLLMLEPPRSEMIPSLHSQFRRVVGEVPSFRMLPPQQLLEVLASANKADLFLGGIVDENSGTLTLTRGDLTTWMVPLSMFPADGPCQPDFGRFALDDYGYTIRFGDFEASAYSILYRIDPEYRYRANKRRIAEDKGFGPSLRRLRILRRLSRDDFPGISPKTLARIERKETEKPHGKTLDTLAKVLGVAPGEIETY